MTQAARFKTSLAAVVGAGAVMLGAGAASAAVIQADFNNVAADPGAAWNTIDSQNTTSSYALHDTNGNSTSVSLAFSGEFASTNDSNSVNDPGAFAGGDFDPAVQDYAFFGGEDTAGTYTGDITFSGLDANTAYTLEIVSARNTSADHRTEDVTVNGDYTTDQTSSDNFNSYTDGAQGGNVLIFNANSGANGQLDAQFSVDSSSDDHQYAYVNAVRLSSAVPEPASLALLGVGGLALLGRRRRGVPEA